MYDYNGAIEWYDKALEIDPYYFGAILGKGRMLESLGSCH
jgi:tetratricopeptide (TPR) repeat protein